MSRIEIINLNLSDDTFDVLKKRFETSRDAISSLVTPALSADEDQRTLVILFSNGGDAEPSVIWEEIEKAGMSQGIDNIMFTHCLDAGRADKPDPHFVFELANETARGLNQDAMIGAFVLDFEVSHSNPYQPEIESFELMYYSDQRVGLRMQSELMELLSSDDALERSSPSRQTEGV